MACFITLFTCTVIRYLLFDLCWVDCNFILNIWSPPLTVIFFGRLLASGWPAWLWWLHSAASSRGFYLSWCTRRVTHMSLRDCASMCHCFPESNLVSPELVQRSACDCLAAAQVRSAPVREELLQTDETLSHVYMIYTKFRAQRQ